MKTQRLFLHTFFPILLLACLLASSCATRKVGNRPFFFIQMSDPQFGMISDNKDFDKETELFTKAVQAANRLHPAFVVITGDLVNKPSDPAQIAEYKRIASQLDSSIPLYSVPGNHDVGNIPNTGTVADYRKTIGADYYSFVNRSVLGIVLNSVYLHTPRDVQDEAEKQEKWLLKTLEEAKGKNYQHIFIFLHHPLFLKQADEADEYFNIPTATRKKYLDIFKSNGIKYIFAGHYHRNAWGKAGDIEMVTTGPVGKAFGDDKSGFRIIKIDGPNVQHQYYNLDSIPAAIR